MHNCCKCGCMIIDNQCPRTNRPVEDAKDAEIKRLEDVVEELVDNLKTAHDIIEKNIDIEAFGVEGDGECYWPVLAEYLAKFNQAIEKAEKC